MTAGQGDSGRKNVEKKKLELRKGKERRIKFDFLSPDFFSFCFKQALENILMWSVGLWPQR